MPPPSRASKGAIRRQEIEDLRNHLPIGTYLAALHVAMMTGYLPTYVRDNTGNWVEEKKDAQTQIAITDRERIDLAKFLIDKVMPNHKQVEVIEAPKEGDIATAAESPSDLRHLSEDELRKIADASFEVIRADVKKSEGHE